MGKISIGPGSLYAAIKQLVSDGLVEEALQSDDTRRRYYRLTKNGWTRLDAEITYFENTVRLAKQRGALESIAGS